MSRGPEVTQQPRTPPLTFWVGVAALLGTVAAVATGIGVAQAIYEQRAPLADPWVIGGIILAVLALLCGVWAFILHLAHSHAVGHECPDPAAHRRPRRRAPRRTAPPNQAVTAGDDAPIDPSTTLTPRERQMLALLADRTDQPPAAGPGGPG